MKRLAMKGAALGMALLISGPSVLAADYTQHWAKEAIEKWNGYGVVKGYENGDFRPSNPITRGELAVILDRVFQFPKVSSPGLYMDLIVESNKWYVTSANKVTAMGLMHIEGFLFEPNAPVTREEAAYAIAKAYELESLAGEKTNFKDEDHISSWAVEAVRTLAGYGYINGTPEGNFMPQSTLTRAEVVTMLSHVTSQIITTSGTYTQSVKGNVVVSSPEVVLKDMTIEGNLYITSEVKKTTLDNVVVTGTVYLKGGSVAISGKYEEVRLATGAPITFTAGVINRLVVTKTGSSLKVGEGATLETLVENSPIQIEGQSSMGGGSISGGSVGQGEVPKLQTVGIYISGSYVELPVSEGRVEIDIPSLSAQFSPSDTIEGFKMLATTPGASITSDTGSIEAGRYYTFKELEEQLGLIKEVATDIGISPELIVDQLLGSDKVVIGELLDHYALGKTLAAALGYHLADSYTFERYLTNEQGGGESIYVTLRLQ